MGLFRSKKSRPAILDPLPDWDDTRWRSHLRSNALGTDHHCHHHAETITADRKEAARLYQNGDPQRARNLAESALRNNRIVTALATLSPLCNALYQRSEPLAGYTSLVQIPEPARSGIVTIVFAAAHLQMSFLTETVHFLREQFGAVHIEQIQKGEGDLYPLVNATVRDALAPVPSAPQLVDAELASAVKQYFGVTIASPPRPNPSSALPPNPALAPSPAARAMQGSNAAIAATAAAAAATTAAAATGAAAVATSQVTDIRRTQTTPHSLGSSELGVPVSPQLSEEQAGSPHITRDQIAVPTQSQEPIQPSPPIPLTAERELQAPASAVEGARNAVGNAGARARDYSGAATSSSRRMFSGPVVKAAEPLPADVPELQSKVHMLSGPDAGDEVQRDRTTSVGAVMGGAQTAAMSNGAQVREAVLPSSPDGAVTQDVLTSANGETGREQELSLSASEAGKGELRIMPQHLRDFKDSDDQLLARYEHMRLVLSA